MRFRIPNDTPLRPYAVTAPMNRSWVEAGLPAETRWLNPFDEGDVPYCVALNRANSFAHDASPEPGTSATALGMPRWVLLDCCLLPSVMVGFEAPRTAIPADIAAQLDPSGTLDWIAVSEYVGLPSVEPGRHIGISLFSLVSGLGLGVRSKAMGLRALGSSELIGVTQYASPGAAVHMKFGPLAVLNESVAVHSRPGETFTYRLDVPEPEILRQLMTGEIRDAGAYTPEEWTPVLAFDPRDLDARQAAMAACKEAPTWIVGHGAVANGELTELRLARPRV